MGHIIHSKDEVYRALAVRLNKNPVGAPINDTLMAILQRLYTEGEAMIGSKFPMIPVSIEKIAGITGMDMERLKPILDGMAERGLVMDLPRKDTFYYMLTPMVVGFFEYTFMRAGREADMKELAKLFSSYFDNKEVQTEFAGRDTKFMRTLVYEHLIPIAVETEVLDYERAGEIIRQSGGGSLSICPCRHKAQHLGRACDAPLEVCTTLGPAAEWIIRRGLGKPASVDDLLRVLDETEALGLVHNCDNVLNKPTYICHCCGCCCVVMTGINKHGQYATHPSNFIPVFDSLNCIGCGICADKCLIGALAMEEDRDGNEVPFVDEKVCLGCGVCANFCPNSSVTMSRRSVVHVPPRNGREKFQRIAREKGKA
ncbi:MAG TPA: (Fe-S)-binding protein [Syntrophomonas sp.]|jgi:formate hydrogenlyase subunit 6/NADH:ubiquinone oxidoreductase subunit I|nr:(Fe-S)-binding protein [Syntrophomonas sp.]